MTREIVLTQGRFKRRFLPWILVILAAALIAYTYISTFVTFTSKDFACFHGVRCNYYPDFLGYHYAKFINLNLIIAAAMLVVDLLLIILFCRKRSLLVTSSTIVYKRGRKQLNIPVAQISDIDIGAAKVIVKVPFAKFKFRRLQNKKEIYDTVLSLRNTPTYVAAPVQAAPVKATISFEEQLKALNNQLAAGKISNAEYTKASTELMKSKYPDLY